MAESPVNPESASRAQRAHKFEALGFVAAGIAHELNNLLMVISASADLLQQGTGSAQEHIDAIRTASARAATITGEILAFDRQQLLQMRVLDVRDVVNRSLTAVKQLFDPRARVTCALPDHPLWTRADETKIAQVLMNLGLYAHSRLAADGAIEVSAARVVVPDGAHPGMAGGNYVQIRFRDSGAALDAAAVEHLFDPFASMKAVGSAGLCLPVAYQVMKHLEGWIWATSGADQGVTFEIYLGEAQAPQRKEPAPPRAQGQPGGTVLVVDDQKLVRAVTADFLKSQGYHVLEAASGAAALEVVAGFQGTIDALVSDVVMPGMEGPALAMRLREKLPHLRVIFISGYAAQGADMQRSLAEGARFLSKPVSLQSLAAELRALLK